MVITCHGDNYFRLQSGNLTVLIDPMNARSFKGASLVINTVHPPLTPERNPEETPCISHQGEYEVKGIRVRGFSIGEEGFNHGRCEKTIYLIDFDEICLGVFGYLTKLPDLKIQERFGGVDIIIIPGGGKPFIDEAAAAKLIRQLEPSIIIPALFKNTKTFLKELSQGSCPEEEKLTIKKKDLVPKSMTVRCLKV